MVPIRKRSNRDYRATHMVIKSPVAGTEDGVTTNLLEYRRNCKMKFPETSLAGNVQVASKLCPRRQRVIFELLESHRE